MKYTKFVAIIAFLAVSPTAVMSQAKSVDCDFLGYIAGGFARQNNVFLDNRRLLLEQRQFNIDSWRGNQKIDDLSKANILLSIMRAFTGEMQDDVAFEQEIISDCQNSRGGLNNPNY